MIRRPSAYQEAISNLFQTARLKNYPKNQLVQYQGDPMTDIYMIKAGYIKVYTILETGDTRTLFILGPGDVFPVAFSTTLDWSSYKLKYFYQCLTDMRAAIMASTDFKKMIDEDAAKQMAYLSYMTATNNAIMNQLEAMKQKSAISRIVFMLPYLIKKMGRQIGPAAYQLRIKLTHQEIADLSGVTRETTTTLVKKLEKQGAIEQKKGRIIIHKRLLDKLRK